MKAVRCAIYTRKSSDEGLEQSFNSLDAQREACAAYILSQASEGWTALPEVYDDGGLSGGSLDRPALQRLLAEVAAGRVDIIVVYKVDRLTRSLLDFSKLVEAFDEAGTSFVSITQSFNTTTSMGRLTLNMLLSFAQFEREVTAERIRDKIAASKAKGMWMGGVPPLGYAPDGRSLAIVEAHARIIRHIFARYLVLGNVRLLADELRTQGTATPRRTTLTERETGGRPFSRGQLYRILNNVTYAGEIAHGDKRHPGQHAAIIDARTFAKAQQLLADHRNGVRQRVNASHPSLLAGKLRDCAGKPLVATHTTAGSVRYRYYVSEALQHRAGDTGMRIPAREIEGAVAARVAEAFDDPLALMATLKLVPPADRIDAFFTQCSMLADACRRRCFATLTRLVTGVAVHDDRLDITSETDAIAAMTGAAPGPDAPTSMLLTAHVRLARSGRALRLVQRDGGATQAEANAALVGKLVQARRWWEALRGGELDVTRLAEREGVTRSYICRIVRFAFLSPEVISGLLAGTQRAGISAAMLRADGAIPLSWAEQRRLFLPGLEDAAS